MSGAMVRVGNGWRKLSDPRRHPSLLLAQCFGGIGGGRKTFRQPDGQDAADGLDDPGVTAWQLSCNNGAHLGPLANYFSNLGYGITLDHDGWQMPNRPQATSLYAFMCGPAALLSGGMGKIQEVPAELSRHRRACDWGIR